MIRLTRKNATEATTISEQKAMDLDWFTYDNGNVDIFRRTALGWVPWLLVRPSAVLESVGLDGELGVYAAQDLPAGTAIGRYLGFVVGKAGQPQTEADAKAIERSGDASYLIKIRGIIVDGARPPQDDAEQLRRAGCVLYPSNASQYPGAHVHLINDSRGTNYEDNMIVARDGMAFTTMPIPAFDPRNPAMSEALWSYGSDFWELMEDLAASKKGQSDSAARAERAGKRQRRG